MFVFYIILIFLFIFWNGWLYFDYKGLSLLAGQLSGQNLLQLVKICYSTFSNCQTLHQWMNKWLSAHYINMKYYNYIKHFELHWFCHQLILYTLWSYVLCQAFNVQSVAFRTNLTQQTRKINLIRTEMKE